MPGVRGRAPVSLNFRTAPPVTVLSVGITLITRPAVLAAIAEYDELGKNRFLDKYGFGEARDFEFDGRRYDSKAIVGAAYGHLPGQEALTADSFSGGEQTVARRLRSLGFVVPPTRAPVWARDELILACELVMTNDWKFLNAEDKRVIELPELLQLLPLHPPEVRGPKFRNGNGVARKTVDIATRHPEYRGARTKGGALDEEVLRDFLEQPHEMLAAAAAIREGVRLGTLQGVGDGWGEGDEQTSAPEGRLLERRHYARERNPKLRARKIASFLRTHPRVICEVCGFDFEATYGPRGSRYTECHHVVPLHASGETTTRLTDLVLLCSNCHRMIHRGRLWLTPDELRGLLSDAARR